MSIPKSDECLLPILEALSGTKEMSTTELTRRVADAVALSPENREAMHPHSGQGVFANRVSWARLDLKLSGLVEQVRRGFHRITPEGEALLRRLRAGQVKSIDRKFLRDNYPSFAESSKRNARSSRKSAASASPDEIPRRPMSIPKSDELLLPILDALSGGKEMSMAELYRRVADAVALSPKDREARHPHSGQRVFAGRVRWARLNLHDAGLIMQVRHGVHRITPEGEALFLRLRADQSKGITRKFLRDNYPSFAKSSKRSARSSRKSAASASPDELSETPDEISETPDEALENAFHTLRSALEAEVLDRVRTAPPEFLEHVVVDLMIAMGYGGGDASRGQVLGRTGDGGVDGVISEDALGLDLVYLQAKKYAEDQTVGVDHLRNFAGAMDAKGTTKGVFVTTARFTRKAEDYAKEISKRITLIDGGELARRMVKHNVGVLTETCYETKRVDKGYFEEV